jgi:alpha-tubulin suppressor-like RCC1 family protein
VNVGGTGAISGLTAITTGNGHSCAVTDGAGVLCWGWNATGEVGDNLSADALSPVQVIGLSSGVIALGTGYRHNCVTTSDGGVMCWGLDSDGELGNNRETSSRIPVAVVGVGGSGLLNVN